MQRSNVTLDQFRAELAFKLRTIREFFDYTLEDMATQLGTSCMTVRHYEGGGETQSLLYLARVAEMAGITLEDLVTLNKKEFMTKLYLG